MCPGEWGCSLTYGKIGRKGEIVMDIMDCNILGVNYKCHCDNEISFCVLYHTIREVCVW